MRCVNVDGVLQQFGLVGNARRRYMINGLMAASEVCAVVFLDLRATALRPAAGSIEGSGHSTIASRSSASSCFLATIRGWRSLGFFSLFHLRRGRIIQRFQQRQRPSPPICITTAVWRVIKSRKLGCAAALPPVRAGAPEQQVPGSQLARAAAPPGGTPGSRCFQLGKSLLYRSNRSPGWVGQPAHASRGGLGRIRQGCRSAGLRHLTSATAHLQQPARQLAGSTTQKLVQLALQDPPKCDSAVLPFAARCCGLA